MKRRLTLITAGATFSSTVEHDEAELLLERWRAVIAEEDGAPQVVQLDGMPVMHVALCAVVAVKDEIDCGTDS